MEEGEKIMDMILEKYKSDMVLIRNAPGDWDGNGDYVEGTEERINFTGACMPLSDNDYNKNPNGGYTADDRKIYTSLLIKNGEKVEWNGSAFTVDKEKEYPTIDGTFKRYFIKRVVE